VLLEFPSFQGMLDDDPLGMEVITQEAAVAFPEELLRAHNRSLLASSDLEEPLDARAKLLGQHVIRIVAKADVLETFIKGSLPTRGLPTPS